MKDKNDLKTKIEFNLLKDAKKLRQKYIPISEKVEGTQKVFNHRAKMNTLAAQGKWSRELEN